MNRLYLIAIGPVARGELISILVVVPLPLTYHQMYFCSDRLLLKKKRNRASPTRTHTQSNALVFFAVTFITLIAILLPRLPYALVFYSNVRIQWLRK